MDQMKGCLFNLIIYADEKRRMEYYKNIIDSVIEKFPTLIMMIQPDQKSSDKIKITESNDNQSKQYQITGSQELLEKDPFAVLPLIASDLPVYLIWDKDPTLKSNMLSYFETISKRMIYGSECSDDLSKFSREMLKKRETYKGDLMDLDWALLRPWRDVISKVFSTQEKVEQLKNSKKIALTYNNAASAHVCRSNTQALYLQGWLAGVFDWKIITVKDADNKSSIQYDAKGNKLEVELTPKKDESRAPGAILSLRFESFDRNECDIKISTEHNKVIIKNSCQEKCEVPFTLPLANLERGLSFVKELFFHEISNQYYLMLKKIAQIKKEKSWW